MNDRENKLRAYTFKNPGRIPTRVGISMASWDTYETHDLEKLIAKHKYLFPNYKTGAINRNNLPFKPYRIKDVEYTDSWGCVWKTSQSGSTGSVIKHPLENWDDLENFMPPDPEYHNGWERIDWQSIEKNIMNEKKKGEFSSGGLRHGYLFMTLSYIRGFENLMYDMHDEDPKLDMLIKTVENFNQIIIDRFLGLDVDMIGFPEDLGSQKSLLLSPGMFRRYIKPVYMRLMQPVKKQGKLIHMHSDGYIMDIIEDLIECGVNIINLQDLVNGIDDIQKHIKGRMAIDLDIDRQDITVSGSPKDIDNLIREAVVKLGSKKGGLSMIYGLYPGTPLKNAEAVMAAMEKYSKYYC